MVNAAAREISAKIVYYGPGLSGKTTSLQRVHATAGNARGELVSLSTEGDRTLFFDYLPLKVEQVRGLTLRLHLYTVPGQVFYDATRKLVLNGADGVVFVADSQPLAMDSNLESMANLETNLAEMGVDPATFPFVIQWNKRDLPGVLPVEALRARLNRHAVPEFPTVASRGEGVLDALKGITRLVVRDLKARQPRTAAARPMDLSAGGSELASRISAAADAPGAPRPAPTPAPQPAPAAGGLPRREVGGLSFARLFPGEGAAVAEVELAIRERAFAPAIRLAARAVEEILAALSTPESEPAARAVLLGLDGREYLRLGRLATRPDGAASEQDALFALHLLVAAKVKAERI